MLHDSNLIKSTLLLFRKQMEIKHEPYFNLIKKKNAQIKCKVNIGAFFEQQYAFVVITGRSILNVDRKSASKSVFKLYNKRIAAVIVIADLRRLRDKSNILFDRYTDKLDRCWRSNPFSEINFGADKSAERIISRAMTSQLRLCGQ